MAERFDFRPRINVPSYKGEGLVDPLAGGLEAGLGGLEKGQAMGQALESMRRRRRLSGLVSRVVSGEATPEEKQEFDMLRFQEFNQLPKSPLEIQKEETDIDKNKAYSELVRAQAAALGKPKPAREAAPASEQDIRKEFQNQPEVKQYIDLSRSYRALNQALQEAKQKGTSGRSRASADQALITLFNKMLDPSSVVREGEYARSFEGQSALARVQGSLQRLAAGGAGLSDEERSNMISIAQRLFNDSENIYNQQVDFYGNIAEEQGIPRKRIIPPILRAGTPSKANANKPGSKFNIGDSIDVGGQTGEIVGFEEE